MRLIGLDFEASGTDIGAGAVPIQLGLAWENDQGIILTEDRHIGGWNWKDGTTWDEESAEVHGIKKEYLVDFPPAWKVDIDLAYQLMPYIGPRMWNLPVGWNVAGFDMPFIRRWFPNLSRMLSYRSIDLTPLVIAMSGENEGEYKKIKKAAKDYAASKIPDLPAWHDAGYDAEAALHSYAYLTNVGFTEETTIETKIVTGDTFNMEAACRTYTHDYDMLPETQKANVQRIITSILKAGAT